MNIFHFLKEKTANIGIGGILRNECEGWLFALTGWIPGTIGFFSRYLVLKLFAGSLSGSAWIQPAVTIVHANRLQAGKFLGINSGTYLNAIGGITMGNYVLIGSNVTISSGRHPIAGATPAIFARGTEPMPIVIGDDVWIGAGAVIMPGITLGKGTVIGANSVVTRDTEEYSVNVGAPARKIRSRVPDEPVT